MTSPDLDLLLEQTSRTFALSIPRLPEPSRFEVTVAYLLFRIADTFEDAAVWPADGRIGALHEFCALLREPSEERARSLADRWVEDRPSGHEGYLRLLGETAGVLEAYCSVQPAAREVIRDHVIRSAEGMASIVARTEEGGLELRSLDELRDYCYIVAGIVGEMLTELFLLDSDCLGGVAGVLRARAAVFGEGLQLVNILKDAADDAAEGRVFLPRGVDLGDVFALARDDLRSASEYVLALQEAGAPRGFVAFTALPVDLAWATLDKVERHGPGAKVSRPEVYRITRQLEKALDRNEPALRMPEHAGKVR